MAKKHFIACKIGDGMVLARADKTVRGQWRLIDSQICVSDRDIFNVSDLTPEQKQKIVDTYIAHQVDKIDFSVAKDKTLENMREAWIADAKSITFDAILAKMGEIN